MVSRNEQHGIVLYGALTVASRRLPACCRRTIEEQADTWADHHAYEVRAAPGGKLEVIVRCASDAHTCRIVIDGAVVEDVSVEAPPSS